MINSSPRSTWTYDDGSWLSAAHHDIIAGFWHFGSSKASLQENADNDNPFNNSLGPVGTHEISKLNEPSFW